MPINRQYTEAGGKIDIVNPNSTNWMAVHNLKELNRAVKDGLWGGRAKVFEFGSNALKGTKYEHQPSTTGAVLNFLIAQHTNEFVGTRISSYSMDLLHTRFYNATWKITNIFHLGWDDGRITLTSILQVLVVEQYFVVEILE